MFCPFVIALQFHFDPLHRGFCQVILLARAVRSLAADLLYLASRIDEGEICVGLTPPMTEDEIDWAGEEEEADQEFRGSD